MALRSAHWWTFFEKFGGVLMAAGIGVGTITAGIEIKGHTARQILGMPWMSVAIGLSGVGLLMVVVGLTAQLLAGIIANRRSPEDAQSSAATATFQGGAMRGKLRVWTSADHAFRDTDIGESANMEVEHHPREPQAYRTGSIDPWPDGTLDD